MGKMQQRITAEGVPATTNEQVSEIEESGQALTNIVSRARRAKFVGYFFAMVVTIVMPLISLGYVDGPWLVPLWDMGHSDYSLQYVEAIPVWSCQPPGYLGGGEWSFLGIDIRFGKMSFGQAKTVDMVWNWVAGRGVQFALAWFTYHVFTSALMRTAEMVHVPYDLFASLALYSARPGTIWDILKGLMSIPGLRIKFILGWVLFSTVYLAAFPSLLDVMSGYEGSIKTALVLPNKTQVDISTMQSFNGILYSSNNPYEGAGSYTSTAYDFYDDYLNTTWRAYQDYLDYGNTSVTTFYTQDPANYNCVAEQGVYQWGFSGEWVLVVICVNGLWVFGLWILWVDTELKSQFTRVGRRMGTYRAIADIAEAMREDLGPNLCAYSDKELANALKTQGRVKYYVTEGAVGEPGHIGLSSRMSDKVRLDWGEKYG